MAAPPYPYWVVEQSPHYRGVRTPGTLFLFAAVTLLLLSLLGGPQAYAEHVEQANRGKPPTLCQEHAGRPGWDAICAEARRH